MGFQMQACSTRCFAVPPGHLAFPAARAEVPRGLQRLQALYYFAMGDGAGSLVKVYGKFKRGEAWWSVLGGTELNGCRVGEIYYF